MNNPARAERGHLFVVHADLSRLGCDDVLIPTDVFLATLGR